MKTIRYVIFLFVLFPILISTQQVFADTYFVSTVPGSSVPGCEESFSCYSPYQTRISVGDSVIWTNDDSAAHTVTSGTPSLGVSGIFDSSLFMSGASFEVEFFEEGIYDYFCMVHPWMIGTVLVSSSPSESSQSTSSGITPRGTPIPLDTKPKSVSGFTTYYNDKWDFSIDVPNGWNIDDSILIEEGWEQIVFLTPDPIYASTYVAIDYFFDDYTYQGLYGNDALRELERNVKSWCDSMTISIDGFTCTNFEMIQTDIEDDLYIVSYTFTERGGDGTIFEKMAVLSVYPVSDSEYFSIDVEINFDDLELYSQPIGYMLTSSDFSLFPTTEPTSQPRNDIPVDLNFRNYNNNEFGFSINYPFDWIIDDELFVDGDYYSIVTFAPDYDYLQTIEVGIAYDDFDFRGLSSSQYISALEDLEADYCTFSSYDVEGFRCSNYEISDELSGSITDYSGNRWHALYFTYTEHYPDQSYDVAAARYELPVGDDTVIANFYFDLDSYDDYLRNIPAPQLVVDVMSSFELTSTVTTPTVTAPTPTTRQLECGTGTHEENGRCVADSTGGGCLIATATYGSELSPQVQQLREIRDNTLLKTESGKLFMSTFNQFYYSFSPTISDLERENPLFKEAVKLFITPMVSSLSILNYVEMDSEESVLGYGISLIVLNLAMYVGIPASVIIGIKKKF